jgi:hypothetical protein
VEKLDDDVQLWRDVTALSMGRSGGLTWQASMLPSQIEKFLTALEKSTGIPEKTWQIGLGDGRMRMLEPIEPDAIAARVEVLNSMARDVGATFIVEGTDFSSRIPQAQLKLMTRIKEELDPQSVFVDQW